MPEVTRIEARYVVRSRLASLLQDFFGEPSNYSVKSQGDLIEITAPRKLTEAEIEDVTHTE
ncbi:hypothetical protein BDW59DRAFT_166611 [Aspergillus cavernicola]|uniref:Uncharacterized protein n=1 Tax=Aspergillus cavernicola TaxID=176166 RepID=A0ABR4HJX6_9EURO